MPASPSTVEDVASMDHQRSHQMKSWVDYISNNYRLILIHHVYEYSIQKTSKLGRSATSTTTYTNPIPCVLLTRSRWTGCRIFRSKIGRFVLWWSRVRFLPLVCCVGWGQSNPSSSGRISHLILFDWREAPFTCFSILWKLGLHLRMLAIHLQGRLRSLDYSLLLLLIFHRFHFFQHSLYFSRNLSAFHTPQNHDCSQSQIHQFALKFSIFSKWLFHLKMFSTQVIHFAFVRANPVGRFSFWAFWKHSWFFYFVKF